jgi:UDP-N-acetylglucosamine 2-epimerase (non-hydrolysing)
MEYRKIIIVVGARPNFMKAAPVYRELEKRIPGRVKLCHTGQHYDESMSRIFFEELEMPKPDFYLGAGSGSHAQQTAKIMTEFEKVILREKPDMIMVAGDVNSTIACALTAVKLGVKVSHIEAGLRSFDMRMPEEINRILTDRISNQLFVTEKSGVDNLLREGVSEEKIHFVGNCMIDSLVKYLPKAKSIDMRSAFSLDSEKYMLVTLHRPSNVDDIDNVKRIMDFLKAISEKRLVIFPVHPRTRKQIEAAGIKLDDNRLKITEPLGYLEFLSLMSGAEAVLTDSGGIQEETTFLGVQCVTLRENTERPITVETGTNHLVGESIEEAGKVLDEIFSGKIKKGGIPPLWDGKAAKRIVSEILGGEEELGVMNYEL